MPQSISLNDISPFPIFFSDLSVSRVLLCIMGYIEFVYYLKNCGLKSKG